MKTRFILLGFICSTVISESLAANVGISIDWPTELSVSCEPATPGRTPGRTDLVVSVTGLEVDRAYDVKLEGYNSGGRYVAPRRTRDPSFLYKGVRPGQHEVRVRETNRNRTVVATKIITITAPEPQLSVPATISANTPIKVSLSSAIGPYERGWLYLTLVPAHYPLNARGPGRNSIKESCDVVEHEFKGLPAGNYELRLFQSVFGGDPLLAKRSIVVGNAVTNVINSRGSAGYIFSNTPNQIGSLSYVVPATVDTPISNLWGYDDTRPAGSRLSQNSNSYFKPVDSMNLAIGTLPIELRAFANVDKYGNYDLEGNFQCTALISQYLSLLGFSKAPASIPNGKDVVKTLAEGPNKEFFSPIDSSMPPKVGSIISMNAGTGGIPDDIGHVAIAKGVTVINENKIIVNLIEQNIRKPGTNLFAVNRTIEFVKGSDGAWIANHSITKDGYKYSVLNWTTPIALP